MACAALTGPTPYRLVRPGAMSPGDGQQLGAVVLQLPPGLGERERRAADPGLPDGLLTAGRSRQLTPGRRHASRVPETGPA